MPTLCSTCRPLAAAESKQAWAEKNAAQARQARQRWVRENPEEMAEARRRWKRAHPEKVRQARRDVKRRNPEANRAYNRARRLRLKGQTVIPFTAAQLRARLAYFGGRCWMCGRLGDVIDHVKPVSRGGAHALCNLRPACWECNTKKGATWPFPTSPSSSRGGTATIASTASLAS